VQKADGVVADSVHITEKTLTICYDPARISKDELINLLKQAGAELENAQTDRAPLL
jgi:allophanate hydrolase subunit 1